MQINKILLVSVIFFNGYTAHSQDCVPACPKTITIGHTAGSISPKTVTIIYHTKKIGNLCWILQNLGAEKMATKVDDTSADSRGWYFGFKEKQGHAYDGTSALVPVRVAPASANFTIDWQLENDPCALNLGDGWHVTTISELTQGFSGVTKLSDAYAQLKFRASGYYNSQLNQADNIYLFTSTMQSSTTGKVVSVTSTSISLTNAFMYNTGINVRCVKTIL